ncbi:hydrogenase maturation protease [candidate division KSB1 bacterium]
MNQKSKKIDTLIVAVMGIGNEFRGDDFAGLYVVRGLMQSLSLQNVVLSESCGDITDITDMCAHADAAILVDAVVSGARPGTVMRFELHKEPVPVQLRRCSTHVMKVSEAVECARALHILPGTMVFYGIEGECFVPGTGLTEEVGHSVRKTVRLIEKEIIEINKSRAEADNARVNNCQGYI